MKSNEYFSNTNYPPYAWRILDYFFSDDRDAKRRREYLDKGLIPTNNLSLYLQDVPEEIAPGLRHPFSYRNKPFGFALEAFRRQYPELWHEACEVSQKAQEISSQYAKLMFSDKALEASALGQAAEEAYWQKASVMDRVLRQIAPELEAAGIDPLTVCV